MKLSREQIGNAKKNSAAAKRRFHQAPAVELTVQDWDRMIANLKAYFGVEERSPNP